MLPAVITEPVTLARPPKRLFSRTCAECATSFRGHRDARFCGLRCKDAWHNRDSKRGRVAVPFLLAWRAGRGSDEVSKYAYRTLAALADRWNAEDRAAGRDGLLFVRAKMRDGWRAADL